MIRATTQEQRQRQYEVLLAGMDEHERPPPRLPRPGGSRRGQPIDDRLINDFGCIRDRSDALARRSGLVLSMTRGPLLVRRGELIAARLGGSMPFAAWPEGMAAVRAGVPLPVPGASRA